MQKVAYCVISFIFHSEQGKTNLQGKSDDKLPGERMTAKKHKETFIKGDSPFHIYMILVVLTQLYAFVKNLQNYTHFHGPFY